MLKYSQLDSTLIIEIIKLSSWPQVNCVFSGKSLITSVEKFV